MGTRSFTFAQMDEAYGVFKNAAENSALKGGDHYRLIPAFRKSFVSFGCCNDQN
jgi:hypothetical protein